jgi:hypothetical protein
MENHVAVFHEYCQKNKLPKPIYEIVKMEGQSHSPDITVRLKVGEKEFTQNAKTRKIADNKCAFEAINFFPNNSLKNYKYRIVEILSDEGDNFSDNLKNLWDGKLDSFKLTLKRSNGADVEFKSISLKK